MKMNVSVQQWLIRYMPAAGATQAQSA